MKICARELISPIRIQRPMNGEKDDLNATPTEWVDSSSCMAKIIWASGREAMHAMANKSTQMCKIYVRYRDNVTTKHRVLYKNKIMPVLSVTNVENRSIFLEMICDEGAAS